MAQSPCVSLTRFPRWHPRHHKRLSQRHSDLGAGVNSGFGWLLGSPSRPRPTLPVSPRPLLNASSTWGHSQAPLCFGTVTVEEDQSGILASVLCGNTSLGEETPGAGVILLWSRLSGPVSL